MRQFVQWDVTVRLTVACGGYIGYIGSDRVLLCQHMCNYHLWWFPCGQWKLDEFCLNLPFMLVCNKVRLMLYPVLVVVGGLRIVRLCPFTTTHVNHNYGGVPHGRWKLHEFCL